MRHPQLAQRQQDQEFIGRENPLAFLKARLFSQLSNRVFFNPAKTLGSAIMLSAPESPVGEPERGTPAPRPWLTF